MHKLFSLICLSVWSVAVNAQNFTARAVEIMDSVYSHYGSPGTPLLSENYPNGNDRATYLADGDGAVNRYSYLWPYSGTLSANVALYEKTHNRKWLKVIDDRVIKGLDCYYDTRRTPAAYASYINTAPQSDRFYDDNIWLGIDFANLYIATGKKKYLKRAEEVWRFIESGTDDKLGGGIYWCEQKKEGKNTCSNAPGTVLALKLYLATRNAAYLDKAKALYNWTKQHLEDPSDHLYFDHITLSGNIGRAKFAYNTGQMLQAAALLYKITKDKEYLVQARKMAEACYNYFFEDLGRADGLRIAKDRDIWFTAVMMRGFVELSHVDRNPVYLDAFRASLDEAWRNVRDGNGLFSDSFTHRSDNPKRWLLTQAAFAEMMASIK